MGKKEKSKAPCTMISAKGEEKLGLCQAGKRSEGD